jgi:exodeoxyribonuclease VII small subunit
MSKKAVQSNLPENFEEAISLLEEIISEIENDEIKLEVALEKYQNGVRLVKYCQDKLKEVEQKIKILDIDSNTLKDLSVE